MHWQQMEKLSCHCSIKFLYIVQVNQPVHSTHPELLSLTHVLTVTHMRPSVKNVSLFHNIGQLLGSAPLLVFFTNTV